MAKRQPKLARSEQEIGDVHNLLGFATLLHDEYPFLAEEELARIKLVGPVFCWLLGHDDPLDGFGKYLDELEGVTSIVNAIVGKELDPEHEEESDAPVS